MTAAFDDMNFHDLVGLLTEEEQEICGRLHSAWLPAMVGRPRIEKRQPCLGGVSRLRGPSRPSLTSLSTSQEVLWRDLGGRE
jgi:hypothetical protein